MNFYNKNNKKMKLKIQKYILNNGFDKFKEIYIDSGRIKMKLYEDEGLMLLKYDQLNTKYDEIEKECRGLILDIKTFEVVLLSFTKFFNIENETKIPLIDYGSANFYKKEDGSLMSLYYHNDKWNVSTTGMAFGEGNVRVDTFSEFEGFTFADLFWYTLKQNGIDLEYLKWRLNKNHFYMFELMTPLNVVVEPHTDFKFSLLSVRNKNTLEELAINSELVKGFALEYQFPLVKSYNFNDLTEMRSYLDEAEWMFEGFVIFSNKLENGSICLNKVKCKNLDYVAIHHIKGQDAEWRLMSIVVTNEFEEFFAHFPEKKEIVENLDICYRLMLKEMEEFSDLVFNKSGLFEDFLEKYNTCIEGGLSHKQSLGRSKKNIAKYIGQNLPKRLKFVSNYYFKKLENNDLKANKYMEINYNSQMEGNMKKLYKSMKYWINKFKSEKNGE